MTLENEMEDQAKADINGVKLYARLLAVAAELESLGRDFSIEFTELNQTRGAADWSHLPLATEIAVDAFVKAKEVLCVCMTQTLTVWFKLFTYLAVYDQQCKGAKEPLEEPYASKKNNAARINDLLRDADLAIADPRTGEPCSILAVNSRDGYGRYTLANRVTKKRSGSYKLLVDMLPLRVVPDAPRKEAILKNMVYRWVRYEHEPF